MNEADQAHGLVGGPNLGCPAGIDIPENTAPLGAGVEDRWMFGGCEQDRKLPITATLDDQIIGLCPPGQENHAVRVQAERFSDLRPRMLDDGLCLAPRVMQAVRICVMAFLDGEESLEHARIDECARIVIEVMPGTQGAARTS